MKEEADRLNYRTVSFSATEVWLHDFKEIYLEILNQCDILQCLKKCADQIVISMGYDPTDIEEGRTFLDMLSSQGLGDALTRREIRQQLRGMFLQNPLMDNNFAIACSLLTGSILGHPILEQQNQELLLGWLSGDKTVKLSLLRALGMSPARITKYNSRHMLRSLAEVIRMGGYSGLLILIDDLEILLNRTNTSMMKYTRLRREDTYESIRQLIDDIDSMQYLMFFFCMDRALMDDDNYGFKSYQALWMRIQNEVIGERFNCFADIIDLDRLGLQIYTAEIIRLMAGRVLAVLVPEAAEEIEISLEEAEKIRERSGFGNIGIPYLVNRTVLEGGSENV
jgi:hypothetical protein